MAATHICVVTNPRINIVVTKPQLSWLEREMKRLGVTIGEVVRRIIDEKRDGKVVRHPTAPDHTS